MNNKKSQAALEFLTTYSWAFMVILLMVGAMYYFGIFDMDKYLPQKCYFGPQFECVDFYIKEDGSDKKIGFKLKNIIGEDLTIDDWEITNEALAPLACNDLPDTGSFDNGEEKDFLFSDCHDGVFLKGEKLEAKITMTYYADLTPSHPEHKLIGKITGKVG